MMLSKLKEILSPAVKDLHATSSSVLEKNRVGRLIKGGAAAIAAGCALHFLWSETDLDKDGLKNPSDPNPFDPDVNKNGVLDGIEVELGASLRKPNPLLAYLVKEGILDVYKLLLPLEEKCNEAGKVPEKVEEFVDELSRAYRLIRVPEFLDKVKSIVADGEVSEEELTSFKNLISKLTFLEWVKREGYDGDISSKLYESLRLFRYFIKKGEFDTLEKILFVASMNGTDLPNNLAYQVFVQIERDHRISDKISAVRKIFETYWKFGLKDLTIDQIYHVNNATLLIGTDKSILDSLKAIKEYGIKLNHFTDLPEIKDFIGERIASVHVNLVNIFKYNIAIRDEDVKIIAERYGNVDERSLKAEILKSVAVMVERVINSIGGGSDDDWRRGIKPAVENGIVFLRDGLGTEYGDINRIGYQLLSPLLLVVDIKKGKCEPPNIDRLKKNVNPDPDLGGLSPDMYWFMKVMKDLGDKSSKAYRRCPRYAWAPPILPWPNSAEAWEGKTKYVNDPPGGLMREISEIAEILWRGRGYATYLAAKHDPWIIEQNRPFYAVLVYRWLGIPATVVVVKYPGVKWGHHAEVGVWVNEDIQRLIEEHGISHGYGEPTTPGMWQPYQWKIPLGKDYERRGESLKDSELEYIIGTFIFKYKDWVENALLWYRVDLERDD